MIRMGPSLDEDMLWLQALERARKELGKPSTLGYGLHRRRKRKDQAK